MFDIFTFQGVIRAMQYPAKPKTTSEWRVAVRTNSPLNSAFERYCPVSTQRFAYQEFPSTLSSKYIGNCSLVTFQGSRSIMYSEWTPKWVSGCNSQRLNWT